MELKLNIACCGNCNEVETCLYVIDSNLGEIPLCADCLREIII